jgi:hypothetical protein
MLGSFVHTGPVGAFYLLGINSALLWVTSNLTAGRLWPLFPLLLQYLYLFRKLKIKYRIGILKKARRLLCCR